MATSQFTVEARPDLVSDSDRAHLMENPGFGRVFSDHMATIEWTADGGWGQGRIGARRPLELDPAASVLHYATEIFEGLKAYRHEDGSIWTFRPECNARRLQDSARRLALPELPEELFLESIQRLVEVDQAWVPSAGGGEQSLYIRPFIIATEAALGVRPSSTASYHVIAGPAGAYFPRGVEPVRLWISTQYNRAGWGGTGAAKCGGNYAASLAAQIEAGQRGCDQSVFLDDREQTYIDELGGMNVFFVGRDGSVMTPELTGTILPGVTRRSLIEMARDKGREVVERRISMAEVKEGMASGEIVEGFACGTAAVITPIGSFVDEQGEYAFAASAAPESLEGEPVERAEGQTFWGELRAELLDLQYGRIEDTRGWLHRLV